MPEYGMSVQVHSGFAATVELTRSALATEGFGVLTEIDVAATMKAKLDVDLDPYLILGACNPPLAHRAIGIDPSIGLLLPCNVVVRTVEEGRTLVEAMDPDVLVSATGNPLLSEVAAEARERLSRALQEVERTATSVSA
jgi:uncharacterized protein (DUF302 family)